MMFWLSVYAENSYTVHRSVLLKINTLGTVDKSKLTNFDFLFFSFFWFTKLSQVHG